MDEIIKSGSKFFNNPSKIPRLIYPTQDKLTDTFMVVIKMPPVSFDEIIVTIDPSYIDVYAQSLDNDSLLSLINEANTAQTFSTRVKLPEGLDVENADASYKNESVTVYLPYL